MGARQRMLQVLTDGPLVVDELIRRACPDVPRRLALNCLHRLVAAGLVTLTDKPHRTEIAGCLVRLAVVSPAAIGRKFVADPRAVSH